MEPDITLRERHKLLGAMRPILDSDDLEPAGGYKMCFFFQKDAEGNRYVAKLKWSELLQAQKDGVLQELLTTEIGIQSLLNGVDRAKD